MIIYKSMVGRKVKCTQGCNFEWLEILDVGEFSFWCVDNQNRKSAQVIGDGKLWEFYVEPKKKVKKWRAVIERTSYSHVGTKHKVSTFFYKDIDAANKAMDENDIVFQFPYGEPIEVDDEN